MDSHRSVRALELALADEDVDVEAARLWWFLDDATADGAARDRLDRFLVEHSLTGALAAEPSYRVWDDNRHRYVDPEAPAINPDRPEEWLASEIAPEEIAWQVRLKVESVFVLRSVKRHVSALRRPLVGEGRLHIDLGARDAEDAENVAREALSLRGVIAAQPTEISSRVRRWWIRQRLAGNFATSNDGGFFYYHGDAGGGHGGGDGGGGGHGGH